MLLASSGMEEYVINGHTTTYYHLPLVRYGRTYSIGVVERVSCSEPRLLSLTD